MLEALEEYIGILEAELPSLIENERNRLRQNVKQEDEQGLHYAEIAEIQLDEGITTRLITGNALIATWATFESAVQRSARSLEIRKDKLLDMTKKLFERLAIPYPSETRDFYDLRNALAHSNGRIEDVGVDTSNETPQKRKRLKIEQLAVSSAGLKISHDGYLIVSIEFVRRAFEFIKPLLLDLATRTDRERRETGAGE